MKRIALGIIIIVVLTLVGCNKENLKIRTIEQSDKFNIVTSSPTSSPTNNVRTYEDETHKKIQYGKLLFNIGTYHITTDISSNNIETLKCEIDKGKGYTWTKTHMTITVRAIEKRDFNDMESIVSYLSDMYPNYEKIKTYNNVTDDSGIISLYIVTQGELTKYIVCYRDCCYLIESDVSGIYLFKNNPSAYYEMNNKKIECANSSIAYVHNTICFNDNEFEKAEYDIIQGENREKYSAELSRDGERQFHFTLKNQKGENLLTLSTLASDFYDVIKILDINMDGYADVQFLEAEGTLNNSYALYVWDDSAKNFVKVKCDEMLSHFEVHEGYLLNWRKNDVQSGDVEKLIWKYKNTLIKESEEHYKTN